MDKRTVAAVAITIAFFVIWSWLILPYFGIGPAPVEDETPAVERDVPVDELPVEPTPAEPVTPPVAVPPVEPVPEREAAVAPDEDVDVISPDYVIPPEYRQENLQDALITVETDLLSVDFTAMTGSVKSVTLKEYEDFERTGNLVLLEDFTEGIFPTEIAQIEGLDISDRLWRLEQEPLADEDGITRVSFATILEHGIAVTKTYILYPDRYGFALQVQVENLLDSTRRISYEILGPTGVPSEDVAKNDVQGVLATVPAEAGLEGKMDVSMRAAASLITEGRNRGRLVTDPTMRVTFAGALNRYFASVLRPSIDVPVDRAWSDAYYDSALGITELEGLTAEDARHRYTPEQRGNIASYFYTAGSGFVVNTGELAPFGSAGSAVVHDYLMYSGPKESQALAGFDTEAFRTGFPVLLDYGMLEPLVKLILILLRAFYIAIPNWGIAIIILTLVMRGAMHPLMRKSQVSMAKMQKLQPQIKKLQEKYKKDKQRLGQEQMKLMKESGANPLGGCLPMLIQLPIFFALYRSLMLSIELRHAPFILWINDLAQPDRLMELPFVLPLLGTPWLNLLPIAMVSSMIVQQRMMPKGATPEAAQQQRLMAFFMPVFIGFILYNLAAGLNLYIFTSTVFGIAEQWWVKRHLAAQEG